MTERLYLAQPGLAEAEARVIAAGPDGVVLDRSPFYPRAGGQPGDQGWLRWPDAEITVADTVKGDGDTVLHVPAPGSVLPRPRPPEAAQRWTPKRKTVVLSKTWPGLSSVEGKPGWFGLSGACCVSSVKPA